jgi:multidrug efflux pump subunit AcrB
LTLTDLALGRSHFAGVCVLILAALGLAQYPSHPSQEDPDFTIREAVVTTRFPGMSPERIEDLITREIEEAARKIPEAKNITSSSRAGVSVVHVEVYERYFDLDPIWSDLRNKMKDLERELPDGTIGPFVNDDFGRVAVATIAITGDGFDFAELYEVAKRLRQELYLVRGTSQVDVYGQQELQIFVEVDAVRLGEIGISPAEALSALADQNVILPGGRLDVDGYEFLVEPTGRFRDLAEVGSPPSPSVYRWSQGRTSSNMANDSGSGCSSSSASCPLESACRSRPSNRSAWNRASTPSSATSTRRWEWCSWSSCCSSDFAPAWWWA